jgi:hypothetical protein
MTTKIAKKDREEAIAQLRKSLKPGDIVYTILRHVSRSGMLRVISLKTVSENGVVRDISYFAALATGFSFDTQRYGIRIGGCGMDMGFYLVYQLGRVLFPGFQCIGDSCPANDHANGDRDYTPHPHSDGGYALSQRWL